MISKSPETGRIRKHLWISGRVQGVFFRDTARNQAETLGITGFVRNLSDGRVEVIAEGEMEKVEQLVAWCRQGPETARVDRVDIDDEPFQGEFLNFMIKRSA